MHTIPFAFLGLIAAVFTLQPWWLGAAVVIGLIADCLPSNEQV